MRTVLALLFLSACTGSADETPTVTIVSPADGAVTGSTVTLVVEVEDFALVAAEARAPNDRARRGPAAWTPFEWLPAAHAHDPSAPPEGYVEVTVDDEVVARTIALETPLEGLAPGAHTVQVELLYPDGDAFFPGIRDEVSFTVE